MAARLPWIDRRFSFDYPVELYPDIIERFVGTPVRVEDKVRGLSRGELTWSDGGWSIQENIGHLLDLEPLLDGRIDDFLAGLPLLRAADMTNRTTHAARHNDRAIAELLSEFRRERGRVGARLDRLSDADFARVAVHPRLGVPMRLVDAVCFACAHDDYHLARMTHLVRLQGR